jgi:UDP-2-acetamido-3-amino-2,3-dideoxy-glucuronate N-acetyltransferase
MSFQDKLIGLIGVGHWGKNILRNLHEMGVIHTACDVSPPMLEQVRKSYPNMQCTASADDIFQNPEIRAVAIATQAATHHTLVKKALLSDKDVFVEKPLRNLLPSRPKERKY